MSLDRKKDCIIDARVRNLAITVPVVAALLMPIAACAARRSDRITDENVAARIAQARTVDDHEALAHYFHAQAEKEAARQAKHYQAIVNSYSEAASDADDSPARERIREWMRKHCRGVVESYRHLEENYLALAEEHAQMAREIAAGE